MINLTRKIAGIIAPWSLISGNKIIYNNFIRVIPSTGINGAMFITLTLQQSGASKTLKKAGAAITLKKAGAAITKIT